MAESTEAVLEELERRRRDRWLVAALLLVAVLGAAGLLLIDDAATRFAPYGIGAFFVVTVAYAISVAAQERRADRAVRALVAEREQVAALSSRVAALQTVHDAVAGVAASQRLDEAFEALLSAALRLTDAEMGVTWLRVGDSLTVATSRGDHAPSTGTTIGIDEGVAGMVVRGGQSVITGRGGEWGGGPGPSVVAAPLRLPDRVAGVLVLERGADRAPFDEVDRTAVALFAEQAALALRTTTRLDRERERSQTLEQRRDETARLLAATAHDCKAPLSAVIGYVQLLRERDDRIGPERRRSLYDDVLAEARRTSRLVGELAGAASAQAGAPLERTRVDLADLLRRSARTAEGLSHAHGSTGAVTVDAPHPVVVEADEGALERVLANLVDNAVTHSPPGSPVRLAARHEHGRAVVTVEDEGPGVDADDQASVFEAFVSRGRGSGLGLYVVRTLVDAHGGDVRLDGSGGGTRVEVHLPEA